MDLEAARSFLRSNHRAVLATKRRDGTAQLSPVTVGVDGAGRALVSTRQTAMKVRNLRRDPWAVLCVLNDGFFGEYCQVAGPVTFLELPDALEPLVEYYRAISGEHPDWDDYRAAMVRDERLLLQIEMAQVGPNVSG